MSEYKLGERLRSRVSKVAVVVVRADSDSAEIACDGVALARAGEELSLPETESIGPKVEMGKRYEDEAGTVELLCVSAGFGQLSIDGQPLNIKTPKPLPASD